MTARRAILGPADRSSFSATESFLRGRLEERDTLKWALDLNSGDVAPRMAVLEVLDAPIGRQLSEPWRTAWRSIEESWKYTDPEAAPWRGIYSARDRIAHGERTGS